MQRAHVVQAVGQLDQQHADVLDMASTSLRRFSACLAFRRIAIRGGQLGDAVDQLGAIFAAEDFSI
jgi:hypothetical protein